MNKHHQITPFPNNQLVNYLVRSLDSHVILGVKHGQTKKSTLEGSPLDVCKQMQTHIQEHTKASTQAHKTIHE